MNLKDLQYLKYINDIRFITIVAIIAIATYLSVKSPKIKYSTEIQLDKSIDTLSTDTIKLDTNAYNN